MNRYDKQLQLWALSLVEKLQGYRYNPQFNQDTESMVNILSKQLKYDLRDFILPDLFCSDCEYFCQLRNCPNREWKRVKYGQVLKQC